MNNKNRKTFKALFQNPMPLTLEWRFIESLLLAIGAQKIEGSGSRVRFVLKEVVATFHRPHPQKEAKPYQIRDARNFIEKTGITL